MIAEDRKRRVLLEFVPSFLDFPEWDSYLPFGKDSI
jgi:hypothetical protein